MLHRQILFDRVYFIKKIMNERRCVFDPLTELMAYYANSSTTVITVIDEALPIEEKLKQRIINGDRLGVSDDLQKALKTYTALEIINEILLEGMKVVGELFGSGQMQLPFVLQSAETMKASVSYLEPFMDKLDGDGTKGTMVLATVKGDVHDIGKNLVDIILSNNGYRVVNLGIKVPVETMLHALEEHKADAIGMSGLLVKSTAIMKENLQVMQARGLDIPVVLGGAALNRRFVENDLRREYSGKLDYAQDAFDGLRFMQEVIDGESLRQVGTEPIEQMGMEAKIALSQQSDASEQLSLEERASQDTYEAAQSRENQRRTDDTGGAYDASLALQTKQKQNADIPIETQLKDDGSHQKIHEHISSISRNEPVPKPPFFGSDIVRGTPLDRLFEYINEVALIRGQWQFRRGKLTDEEYTTIMNEQAYPILNELKLRCKRERLLQPALVYGYFPCNADGNDLVVYKPKNELNLHTKWQTYTPENTPKDDLQEWVRFRFPRQRDGRYLCLSDYFRPIDSGSTDIVAFHIVTVGSTASEYAHALFEKGNFKDYLFFHGLSVEVAEAMAEYQHKIVRAELGIGHNDAGEIKRLFSQGYQGSRYSFGYPACPNLDDQQQLFELLRPERIGISLTEEFQLVPEQSTSAIVCHHKEAKYFNVR